MHTRCVLFLPTVFILACISLPHAVAQDDLPNNSSLHLLAYEGKLEELKAVVDGLFGGSVDMQNQTTYNKIQAR